ncbi:MAG: hypothetical protein KIS84_11585 [Dokdonella sp.]|nr:hypothetical protein [Dokdonella sp.]
MKRHCFASILLGLTCQGLAACDFPQVAGGSTRSGSKSTSVRAASSGAVIHQPKQIEARSAASQASSTDKPNEGRSEPAPGPVNLIGLEEQELRDLLGSPAAQEDRPPGKIWRYRKGGCALNVTLYPDVQTRKFGTLSYEVKSDDGTEQAKRACLADLQPGGRTK